MQFSEHENIKVLSIPLCDDSTQALADQHIMIVSHISRKKIRVLSLFDGISTGLYILMEKLGLEIDCYFSSEIDKHALRVQSQRFHGKLIQLGCVKSLNEDLLNALGRIDLLIGGSPCDQLTLVNWRRKGLFDSSASGCLFFEYVRIRNFFLKKSGKIRIPFFYLFENTSHMELHTQECISKSLGCSPVVCCASAHLPVLRKRLIWTNIPEHPKFELMNSAITAMRLQDILFPGRVANVAIAKTVTSNKANQLSGPDGTLPVTENNVQTHLTCNEVELLMGLPTHFTDANISLCSRWKLLAKAWCVPQITQFLQPLAELFVKKTTFL